jgi:hypothetical protein
MKKNYQDNSCKKIRKPLSVSNGNKGCVYSSKNEIGTLTPTETNNILLLVYLQRIFKKHKTV